MTKPLSEYTREELESEYASMAKRLDQALESNNELLFNAEDAVDKLKRIYDHVRKTISDVNAGRENEDAFIRARLENIQSIVDSPRIGSASAIRFLLYDKFLATINKDAKFSFRKRVRDASGKVYILTDVQG